MKEEASNIYTKVEVDANINNFIEIKSENNEDNIEDNNSIKSEENILWIKSEENAISTVHKEEPISKTAWNRQDTCEVEGEEWVRHPDGYFHCRDCDKKFKSPADIKRHIVIHTGQREYHCNVCMRSFAHDYTLQRHMWLHNERNIKCPKCDKMFTHEKNLAIHIKILHNNVDSLVCSFCSKTFGRRDYLLKHERIHTGEFPFECDQCDEKFRDKRALKSHCYKTHSVPKPHICDKCGQGFDINSKLEKHMAKHMREKNVFEERVCNECGKSFKKLNVWNRHMIHHSKSKNFQCEDCGKAYADKLNLKIHVMKEHPMSAHKYERVKNIPCDLCDQLFDMKTKMEHHKVEVHGHSYFITCDACGKGFIKKDYLVKLKNHKKKCPLQGNQ